MHTAHLHYITLPWSACHSLFPPGNSLPLPREMLRNDDRRPVLAASSAPVASRGGAVVCTATDHRAELAGVPISELNRYRHCRVWPSWSLRVILVAFRDGVRRVSCKKVRWPDPVHSRSFGTRSAQMAVQSNPEDSVHCSLLCFAVGPAPTAIWSCVVVVGRCPGTAVACIMSDLQVAKSLASEMENSAVWQTTDQIGPVLGSEFVASFDHLAGTRVRTRLFESVKEAGAALS